MSPLARHRAEGHLGERLPGAARPHRPEHQAREYLIDNGQSVLVIKFPDNTGTVLVRMPGDKGAAEWTRVVRIKNYLNKIAPEAKGSNAERIIKIME